jgi:hypothetical protein
MSVPSSGDGSSQERAEARADLTKELISETVAQRVVEFLEPVEIDHEHRRHRHEPFLRPKRSRAAVVEAFAIRQAGEKVSGGSSFDGAPIVT